MLDLTLLLSRPPQAMDWHGMAFTVIYFRESNDSQTSHESNFY